MSDKSLVLELPEELIERAEAAHIDLRRALIQTIERELNLTHGQGASLDNRQHAPDQTEPIDPPSIGDSKAPDYLIFEGTAEFQKAVAEARRLLAELPPIDAVEGIDVADGKKPTRREVEMAYRESLERSASGKFPLRKLGRFAGQIWMSDDFDDPLPDEEWGDLFK